MLTSLSLSGRLAEIKEKNLRYVEVDRVVHTPLGGRYKVDRFLVKFPGERSLFLSAPAGSLIYLNGRLEIDEKYGVIIIDQLDEIFTSHTPLKKTIVTPEAPEGLLPLAPNEATC
jgi:hypothetical protein